jgi:tRNA-2-methylthio-N6-dimethylallyladenosine synthase
MNERDSEAVAHALQDRGYAPAKTEEDADVILLNTCSVRDLAEKKAVGKMGFMAKLKKEKPQLVLGFLGCMAQSRGQELLDRMPTVDLVVGTQKYHRVAEYVDELFRNQSVGAISNRDHSRMQFAPTTRIVDIAEEKGSESLIRGHVLDEKPVTAFVSIMQGCEMFCTFCIVPHTRGAERSRSIPEIVEEVRGLAANGVKEVTLLGQIVNRYGQNEFSKRNGKSAFVQLLEELNEVDGLERIRYTSPHPTLFHDDLIDAHGRLAKLCEHVHLPVQSGSDRILKAMHRTYTVERVLNLVDSLRRTQPAVEICTDIIVGFPGETEEDFRQTVELMKQIQFDNAFIFKYSERRDTPAAALPGKVPAEEKLRRNHELLALQEAISLQRNQADVGKIVEILVEGISKRNKSRLFGRTRTNRSVVFEGDEARHRGKLMGVRVMRATHTLYGRSDILN